VREREIDPVSGFRSGGQCGLGLGGIQTGGGGESVREMRELNIIDFSESS